MLGGRNAWLDTLRAIAISSVIVCHICSSFRQIHPNGNEGWFSVAGIGGHGVDLFFVLSGWLLGCLLLNEKKNTSKIDVKRFWMRRWLRTLPAYYTILLLTVGQRFLQERWQIDDALYFIFIQNYVFDPLPFFGISWTLCVEEQFYLLIAPLLLILSRKEWITCALATLIVFPMVGRWLVGDPAPWVTHLRIDGCALGVLLAHMFINHPRLWKWLAFLAPWGILIGLVALLVTMLQRYRGQHGEMPLSAYGLLSGLLVVQSQASPFWKDRASHFILRYIATRSYSLYLVHVEALALARRLDDGKFVAYLAITLLISVVLAELLYRLVEQPWMAYRDRGKSEASVSTPLLDPNPMVCHQPTRIADEQQSRELPRILDR
jgi:peptidoglycan/LPS O-acetylase OafA/YrhL